MSEADDALLTRLGGAQGIATIVHEMYERVLADPELAPYFSTTSMERLRKMQYEFIVSALGGPIAYTGAELTAAHRGKGINGKVYSRFCGHLADAMEARDVNSTDVHLVLSRLAMYKDKITGDTNVDG